VYPDVPGKHSAATLTEQVNTSLKELGTDCVDIFYLHAADRSVPFAETLKAVNDLHKAGKFVRFAISNYTAFEVAELVLTAQHNGWVRPTLYQGMYNAITRNVEDHLFPALRRYGLDFYAYNPLAGGLFSGKYTTLEETPEEGRFSDAVGQMGARYRERYFNEHVFGALRVVEPVAKKHNISLIQTALRWMVHHSKLNVKDNGPDGIILGVSSLKQLEENLDALEQGPLPEELVQALDKGWETAKPGTPHYWHLDVKYTYDTRKALFGK
jgi:aflatoxin B1 aldehyde reductase